MTATDASFFLDILDDRGFPDLRLVAQMRENKEEIPTAGSYRYSDCIDRGLNVYGMSRPLKVAGYRKLSDAIFTWSLEGEVLTFETFYSLNNSDVDPYLVKVQATATVDRVTLEFLGVNRLVMARYERSYMRHPDQDEYHEGWFTAMAQRITRQETIDRYPYCLARAMSVLLKTIETKEAHCERHTTGHRARGISRRLPSETVLNGLPTHLQTSRRLGGLFYKVLAKRDHTLDELSEFVDQILEEYEAIIG